MIERVKLPAGMTVGSQSLPEPPAPIKRCWARLKPSILASSKAAQSGLRSRNRPTYRFMISSIGTPTNSFGRGCRATLMGELLFDGDSGGSRIYGHVDGFVNERCPANCAPI